MKNGNEHLRSVVALDQLPSDSWIEGVSVRSTGDVIIARFDEAELLSVNVADDPDEPENRLARSLHRFPDAMAIYCICRVPRAPSGQSSDGRSLAADEDEYIVVTGTADLSSQVFGDWVMWRLILGANKTAGDEFEGFTTVVSAERVDNVDLTSFGLIIGFVPLSPTKLAACDMTKGALSVVDLATGAVDLVSDDDALKPPGFGSDGGGGEYAMFGSNRVRFTPRHAWVTNWGAEQLLRIPIERLPDGGVHATGPPQLVADGLDGLDGLVLERDGTAGYLCSIGTGQIWRLDGLSDEDVLDTDAITVSTVRDDLVTPTVLDLVYPPEGSTASGHDAKPTLYVACCGRVSETKAANADFSQWLEASKLDTKLQITVTVTTEVTYEYI